jgi:hypothetical protein
VCFARHDADDQQLGQLLCLECYDHDHQAIWNYYSGELWRRTKQAIERHLAALCRRRDIPSARIVSDSGRARSIAPVRVSHGKVAEMQRRGAVHFHVLLRLDGVDPDDRDALAPPPAGITVNDLDAALHAAARQITVTTPAYVDRPEGWVVAWGEQVDVRHIDAVDGDLTDRSVAGYLAKYATKSTEVTCHCSTRLTPDTIDSYAEREGDHLARLIDACWRLGRPVHATTMAGAATTGGVKTALTAYRTPMPGCAAGHTCSASVATSSPRHAATPSPSACSATPSPPTAAPRTTPPPSAPSPSPGPAGSPKATPSLPTPPPHGDGKPDASAAKKLAHQAWIGAAA